MKTFGSKAVKLTAGYLFDKQELNRKITVNAVYDRFNETGRMEAFKFAWKEGEPKQPHYFWDSDVAKWVEGAAYILAEHPDAELERKVDEIVADVKAHQEPDGYFNIYYTVVEPGQRFTNRDRHELYCAGHLMEAAVALDEYLGKRDLLDCMEKYADLIKKVFIDEKSAPFFSPGHEEIELALVRMYNHTGNKKYLDMAAHFINVRGTVEELYKGNYDQSHLPVREQEEAVGHAVRALYLYVGMAQLAKETGDEALAAACRKLFADATEKKMYVTGGLGSTRVGESFTYAYDLPNDTAYAETCASIALMFLGQAMSELDNNAAYADAVERAMYNGMMSGLSIDGKAFFYENPLELNVFEQFKQDDICKERFHSRNVKRPLPITQRVECFRCSCCPPNIVRLFPMFGTYVYGIEGETLFVNQFVSSTLEEGEVKCVTTTDYPRTGNVTIKAQGVKRVAVRVPFWCESFKLDRSYEMKNGYAYVDIADGDEINVDFDMTPTAVYPNKNITRDMGRMCIMRGPVVYCAEGIDNGGNNLHRFTVPDDFGWEVAENEYFGLPTLKIDAYEWKYGDTELYSHNRPTKEKTTLTLIPYNSFANRGETDMLVWLRQ